MTNTNHGVVRALLPTLALAALAGAAQAAAGGWVSTATTAHDPRDAVHVGPLRAGEPVHLTLSLKVRDQPGLDALATRLARGDAGAKPLTAAQFRARHSPTPAQAQAVVDYLRAQGFVNIEVADNRLIVTADGVAGSVRRAFDAELHEYRVDGRRAYANVSAARVPAALGDIVLDVLGLQTVHQARVASQQAAAGADGALPAAVTGVNPVNYPAIYGASNLATAGNATIGIVTVGSMTQTIADLRSFASNAGFAAPPVSTVVVSGGSSDTSGTTEWNIDSQSSLGAAGGAVKAMLLYATPSFNDGDLSAAYNKAVSDDKASVVNVSIQECENSSSARATDNQTFQAAIAQGQTFAIASGDNGAYECGTSGKAQSWPASSPYVMAIGGTRLSTSNGNAWAGETVWACASASACQQSNNGGGAGGGPSLTQAAPSWQKNSGVLGSSTARGVPDISFDGDPSSGALILVKGANQQWGGTSLAAPIFAGFWARIQSINGNGLAFPASAIYAGAAAHPEWFHDVTSGSQGYSAATGWDYASGYGSLQVGNFASGLGGGSGPVANFTSSTSGLTASFTDSSTDSGGSINSWSWDFGDGASSTARNPTHTYAGAGSYTVKETVGDGNGKSNSHTATVTVGGAGTDVVVDGGFEAASQAPWSSSTGVVCTNASCATTEAARTGSGYAWLNGYGATHTDTLAQKITLPAGKSVATLSFWLHIDTAETESTAYDTLKLQVLNSSGTVLATLAKYSNLDRNTGYAQKSFDLRAYIGQTISIKFIGAEDSNLQTSFVIDDVSLVVQ